MARPMATRLGPTRSPMTATTAPANPINRWPSRTARLTIPTPGMIRANANAAENSDSLSQPRYSTSALCIHTDRPPPKLERPILENSRKNSTRPMLGGGGTTAASTADVFILFLLPRYGPLRACIMSPFHLTQKRVRASLGCLKRNGKHAIDLLIWSDFIASI